jgi:hypothetical protein
MQRLKYGLTGIMALILLLAPGSTGAQDTETLDYKADFIVQLPDYVTWPAGKDTNADGELVINVVGESPLTPYLQKYAAKSTHKVVVRTVTLADDITNCQILYMATQETSDLAKILKQVTGKSILTVSECHYFARYGVMVNFVTEDDGGKAKVKFEVNRTTLGEAELKMSSKLLKLATII